MRALSKYWTNRLPPGASLYGSCCPSRAVASGPQKFGCTCSACFHVASITGEAYPPAACTPSVPIQIPTTSTETVTPHR